MSNLNIVFDLDSTLADCDHRLALYSESALLERKL